MDEATKPEPEHKLRALNGSRSGPALRDFVRRGSPRHARNDSLTITVHADLEAGERSIGISPWTTKR